MKNFGIPKIGSFVVRTWPRQCDYLRLRKLSEATRHTVVGWSEIWKVFHSVLNWTLVLLTLHPVSNIVVWNTSVIPQVYTKQAHVRPCDNWDLMTHELKNPKHKILVWKSCQMILAYKKSTQWKSGFPKAQSATHNDKIKHHNVYIEHNILWYLGFTYLEIKYVYGANSS